MLTLTRKPGESIHIGDDIEVQVKEVRGNAVRIGIAAPQELLILRGEVFKRAQSVHTHEPTRTADGHVGHGCDACDGMEVCSCFGKNWRARCKTCGEYWPECERQ